jgi:HlyD family secretion protein
MKPTRSEPNAPHANGARSVATDVEVNSPAVDDRPVPDTLREAPWIPESHRDSDGPQKVRRRQPSPLLAVLLLAITVVGSLTYRRWQRSRAWPEGLIQVNGRIEGDRITLSSKFPGRVARLLAREGDPVAKGQAVVQIDDPQTRARLRQAEANLQMATAQANGAGENVALIAETSGAQIQQAEGIVNQAQSSIAASRADTIRAAAAVTLARATARSAAANVQTARAAHAAALANRERAADAVGTAQAQLEAARANIRAALAAAEAAQANDEKASRDARRFRTLIAEGAVSEQTGDLYVAAEKSARAQFESAQQQIAAVEAEAAARQSEVSAARRQLAAAAAVVTQAGTQVAVAREQAAATVAGVRQSQAQQLTAQQVVRQTEARKLQAMGELNQARAAPHQVAASKTNRSQALARIRQARAAVEELRSVLQELSTVTPVSGTVTTRLIDAGEVVGAGAPLLEVVDLDHLYLKVYVPENQIGAVRLGLPARIYVDAFPKQHFDAGVRYIASTAEFTPKEIQTPDERVKLVYAVKLYLTHNPQHSLTPGLPADAVIRWKDGVAWQKPRY